MRRVILAAAFGLLAAAPAFAQSPVYCDGRFRAWVSSRAAGTSASGQPLTQYTLFLRNVTEQTIRFTATANHARLTDRPTGFSARIPVNATGSLTLGFQAGTGTIPEAELLGTTIVTCG